MYLLWSIGSYFSTAFTHQYYLPKKYIQADLDDLSLTFDQILVSGDKARSNFIYKWVLDDKGILDYSPLTPPWGLTDIMSVSKSLWNSNVPEQTFIDM